MIRLQLYRCIFAVVLLFVQSQAKAQQPLYMQTIVVCITQIVRYSCAKACQCGMRHYWQVKVKDKELV